jgi:hypothetical protein
MNIPAAPKETRSNACSWLRSTAPSRAATRLGLRLGTPRPVISSPMGPVTNSRGPELSRSEMFVIVDEIKDCVSFPSPPRRDKTRAISARLPVKTQPTVAMSTATMTSNMVQEPLGMKPASRLRKASLSGASPKPLQPTLKTSSTAGILPRTDHPQYQDENTPPDEHVPRKTRSPPSRLPKSRTMGILQDRKGSVPRPSVNLRPSATHETRIPSSSSSSTCSSQRMAIRHDSPPTPQQLPRVPQTLPPPSSRIPSHHRRPGPDHFLITDAQPSEYWSGRFMALHDRFSAEILTPVPRGVIPPRPPLPQQQNANDGSVPSSEQPRAKSTYPRGAHLPVSMATTTTRTPPHPASSIPITGAPTMSGPRDERDRVRRVFRHLDSLCATEEAHSSLLEWQQAYARRQSRPPPSSPLTDGLSSIVSRIFGATPRSRRRSSQSAVREGSIPGVARA